MESLRRLAGGATRGCWTGGPCCQTWQQGPPRHLRCCSRRDASSRRASAIPSGRPRSADGHRRRGQLGL